MPDAPPVVGLCSCCGLPVYVGDERRETVEHGTGATPEVLLHQRSCRPAVGTRRHN
jgi:hypothetical protein